MSEPVCEWEVSGTPTKAETYTFTVKITPQPDGFGNPAGRGTQQFSITVGTGTADRMLVTSATYFPLQQSTVVRRFDVNYGATYTVYLVSTGAELGTVTTHDPTVAGTATSVFPTRKTPTWSTSRQGQPRLDRQLLGRARHPVLNGFRPAKMCGVWSSW